MDAFPYDSWDEALAAAAENGEGYFTWGPGGSWQLWMLTIMGIVLMAAFLAWLFVHENQELNAAAQRFAAGESPTTNQGDH